MERSTVKRRLRANHRPLPEHGPCRQIYRIARNRRATSGGPTDIEDKAPKCGPTSSSRSAARSTSTVEPPNCRMAGQNANLRELIDASEFSVS